MSEIFRGFKLDREYRRLTFFTFDFETQELVKEISFPLTGDHLQTRHDRYELAVEMLADRGISDPGYEPSR